MMPQDFYYFRAWPNGKEYLSLGLKDRTLVKIDSSDGSIWFSPLLYDYEWSVVAEVLANSVLRYQELVNELQNEIDSTLTT